MKTRTKGQNLPARVRALEVIAEDLHRRIGATATVVVAAQTKYLTQRVDAVSAVVEEHLQAIRWTCEGCGYAQHTPRVLLNGLTCRGCGAVQAADYTLFIRTRAARSVTPGGETDGERTMTASL